MDGGRTDRWMDGQTDRRIVIQMDGQPNGRADDCENDPSLAAATGDAYAWSVCHQFGHALQQLLTTAPCSELAGQRGVPTDTLHMCALFMRMWLRQPAVLRRVSRHHESGDPLPDALISQLLDSQWAFSDSRRRSCSFGSSH